MRPALLRIYILCCAVALLPGGSAVAQLLTKRVTLNISDKPLNDVLQQIGRQAGFTFSYNSKAIAGKRPVSVAASNKTVQEVLDALFTGECEYKEDHGHVILQPHKEKWYTLSGYVLDAASGAGVSNASVYERQQLVATLTNDQGFFKLRLRDKYPTASVTISKEWYTDTSIVFSAGGEQLFQVPVRPIRNIQMNDVVVTPTKPKGVSGNWLGRMLLTSRQKVQGLNISRFIANRPYQVSLIPGIGTHGSVSGEVVNKISLNVLGGYTAGTRGAEVGGIFNISKEEMTGTQIAGVFNVVGGKTCGVQVAGLYNSAQDSVTGVQVAGLVNTIGGGSRGVVIGGIANKVNTHSAGTHIAGVINIDRGTISGMQIAGVVNYARKIKGVQIGVVNIADTLDGYSIGLLNINKNGYHKISVSSNETLPVNLALKTGNSKLYTLLLGGMDFGDDKAYSFGVGFGHSISVSRRLSFSAEFTVQHIYLGSWDYANILYRFQPDFHVKLSRYFSFFVGPALVRYESEQKEIIKGYKQDVGGESLFSDKDEHIKEWIGWHAGITIF